MTTLERAEMSYVDALDLERDGFGHYVAGFFDGEGSFHISCHRRAGRESEVIRFSLNLRADDASIVREIQSRLRFGTVSYRNGRQREKHDGGTINPGVTWYVNDIWSCWLLCLILDRFPLRAKKRRDFEIWKRAVETKMSMKVRSGTHRCDWTTLAAMREELADVRRYRDGSD